MDQREETEVTDNHGTKVTAEESTQRRTKNSKLFKLLGVTPLPTIIILILFFNNLDVRTTFENPNLLLFLNATFGTAVSLLVALLSLWRYLRSGSTSMLLTGCGLMTYGLGFLLSGALIDLPTGPNTSVTIHNIGVLTAATFHFASLSMILLKTPPENAFRRRRQKLLVACLAVLVSMGLIALASSYEITPKFFAQGIGPTPLRQTVLISAVILFSISALISIALHRASAANFLFWYALALGLIAIGLSGVMLQKVVGSPIGWSGRFAQYIGSIYFLIAASAARTDISTIGMPLEDILASFFRHRLESLIAQRTRELRQAKKELEEQQKVMKLIFDAVPAAIWYKDRDNRILRVNEAGAKSVGMSVEDIEGKTAYELFPEEADHYFQDDLEVIQSGKPKLGIIERLQSASGEKLWVHTDKIPYFDEQDNTIGLVVFVVDITERRRAEEALLESEKRYRELVENSPQGILVSQGDRFILSNQSFAEMVGYSVQELLDFSPNEMYSLVHSDEREMLVQRFLDLQSGKDTGQSYEHRFRRKDGETRWAQATVTEIEIHGTQAFLSMYLEITDRKKAEEALQESEEKFRTLFEHANDSIFIIDPVTRKILDVNENASVHSGYTQEELQRMTINDIYPPQSETRNEAIIQELQETGSVIFEHIHRRKDGTDVPVEISSRVIKYGGKRVFQSFVRDISKRKRTEAELRYLNEDLLTEKKKLEDIVSGIGAGLSVLDSTTRIIWANETLQDWFGPTEKLYGRPCYDLYELSDPQIECSALQTLKSRRTERGRAFGIDVHGDRRYFQLTTVPQMNEAGEIFQIVELTEDITELKQTEEDLLKANRRLEETLSELKSAQLRIVQQERLAAVGQLAAGIAHDFNNILVPITLYTEVELKEHGISAQTRKRLKTILKQAQRASALTDQILDFSRKSVLEKKLLDLVQFFEEFEDLLTHTLPENLHIQILHGSDEFIINADRAHMQQVFMNLALNARDAMQEGGELRIDLSRLKIKPGEPPPYRDMQPGEWVQVDVSDTGLGIKNEHLGNIFEPFFTTKDVGEGTGLGLAQVFGIVKQHDGYIEVKSRVGKGTTFSLYLPAASEGETPEPTGEIMAVEPGGKETLLVVEDNEIVQNALCEILEMLNYRVFSTASSLEALKIFEREEIDLVMSDLVMPEMSGIELFEALREKDPEVRLVIITGYPMGENEKKLLEQGIIAWIRKPFDTEKVAQTVRDALVAERIYPPL